MLINFRYQSTEELIESCSHQECLTIAIGDSVVINGQSYVVADKIYIDPHNAREVNIFMYEV